MGTNSKGTTGFCIIGGFVMLFAMCRGGKDDHRQPDTTPVMPAATASLQTQAKMAEPAEPMYVAAASLNQRSTPNGYKKWWGSKSLTWFNPPGNTYSQAGFDVAINSEIGLIFNGQRHVLKLFLKTEPLTKTRADLIVTLMAHVLGPMEKAGTEFCVLDVRNGKAFSHSSTGKNFKPMVDAELSYIASLWPHV